MHYIQEALLEVLKEKSLDKIAVKDVCDQANISRQTVYYHYDSLINVFQSWFEKTFAERFKSKGSSSNWPDGYREVLLFCREYKEQLLNVYNSSYRTEFIKLIREFARGVVTEAIEDVSNDKGIPMVKKDKLFLVEFYMTVLVGFLAKFIDNGMEEDPDYLTKACAIMIGGSIEEKERAFNESYK